MAVEFVDVEAEGGGAGVALAVAEEGVADVANHDQALPIPVNKAGLVPAHEHALNPVRAPALARDSVQHPGVARTPDPGQDCAI